MVTFLGVVCYFNPRPRKEGDIAVLVKDVADFDFNPRPRKEGDAPVTVSVSLTVYFNPRPRKEGDSSCSDKWP